MSNALKDFLNTKQSAHARAALTLGGRREAWLAAVANLYDTVEHDWLKEATAAATVRVDREREVGLNDENLGPYAVPVLRLAVGDEFVHFVPKDYRVAGADGRIDIQGDRGAAVLLWHGEPTWSVLVERVPKLVLSPLDEASFLDVLKGVMR